jgi:hypothetical protein
VKPQSDLSKASVRHLMTVGGRVALDSGFSQLAKRAGMDPVSPWGVPDRAVPTAGASDPDLKIFEQEITDERLTCAEATRRFLAAYRTIANHAGQRVADLIALNERAGRA